MTYWSPRHMQPAFNGHNCHGSKSDVNKKVGANYSDYFNSIS